ncbi:response regulator [Parvularcula maris]|uniref:Response regulator n=1 Tax=Parvularcula maris TaxID=2965077 RepID=A0A9X2L6R6_9PROT|nr:response regulator [Parvularcula maris]MCQ8183986.1 response regulator [Parvularcula maris]
MGSKESRQSRILFLEDEIILTLTFEDVLHHLDLGEVVTAHSLREAYEAMDQDPFDIAILDFNIDGATSVEVAERVVKSGGRVIFATGHAPDELNVSGFPYDVVTKPYQEDSLRSAVLLAHRELQEALSTSKKAAGF